ncbi:MAG: PDZ domain-containing protein [Chloroflexi bacterium]|nr:PDZ domain-containing protein [Chloroflexota bacterium]
MSKGPPPKTTKDWLVAGLAALLVIVTFVVMARTPAIRPFGWTTALFGRDAVAERDAGNSSYPFETNLAGRIPLAAEGRHPGARPYLGITYLPVTEAVAEFYDLGGAGGVLITAVDANSPAYRAGLSPNDVILAFDGTDITAANTLVAVQLRHKAGDTVSLILLRQKERRRVDVTLAHMGGN